MAGRLNINKITSSIEDWICIIQVIDKGHYQINKDGNKKYQLMILQDEEVFFIKITNSYLLI